MTKRQKKCILLKYKVQVTNINLRKDFKVKFMTDKKEVYLTKEGYEEAKKELDYLINVKRPENIIAIRSKSTWRFK